MDDSIIIKAIIYIRSIFRSSPHICLFIRDFKHSPWLDRFQDCHLLKYGSQVLHFIFYALCQFTGQSCCHIRTVRHCRKPFIRKITLDNACNSQFGCHQPDRTVLHGSLVIREVNLHPRGFLVDAPRPSGGLPQGKQVVGNVVVIDRGKIV